MKNLLLLPLLFMLPYRAISQDASKIVTKEEIETVIGGKIKNVNVEPDKSIARYYAENGKPYQEAVIVSVGDSKNGTYDYALKISQSAKYFKNDVKGFGDKAFWEEASGVYGTLHVVKGSKYISINVGQSKSPLTYFDAAKKLMDAALKRL